MRDHAAAGALTSALRVMFHQNKSDVILVLDPVTAFFLPATELSIYAIHVNFVICAQDAALATLLILGALLISLFSPICLCKVHGATSIQEAEYIPLTMLKVHPVPLWFAEYIRKLFLIHLQSYKHCRGMCDLHKMVRQMTTTTTIPLCTKKETGCGIKDWLHKVVSLTIS